VSRPDVAIVGAGVTGLSVAFHLAEAGASAIVVERQGVGAGASGVQPGGVRQQWSTRLTCELAREGVAFYRDLPARLGTSIPVRFDACGYLFVAHTAERLDELAESVAMQNELGIPSRLVSAAEAAELVPGLDASGLAGASWCDEDGYVDRPQAAVESFAQAAAARGVRVEHGEVTSLAASGSGWTITLRTGERIDAGQVVVAAGIDTPSLVSPLGVDVRIVAMERHLFYTDPVAERVLEPLVVSPERQFAAKQLADGRILASDLSASGPLEEGRRAWLGRIRTVIDELLPRLTFSSFSQLASGSYDTTPDNHPVLGPVDGHPGLHLAAGFSGHGFMLAPAVGRRVADAALGGAPDEALRRLAHTRFATGALHRELATV
jgi:sarcosine oxidase, subunit beta